MPASASTRGPGRALATPSPVIPVSSARPTAHHSPAVGLGVEIAVDIKNTRKYTPNQHQNNHTQFIHFNSI